jgi:hypothetical protein
MGRAYEPDLIMTGTPCNNREAVEAIVMEDKNDFLCLTPIDRRWYDIGFPASWSGCFNT